MAMDVKQEQSWKAGEARHCWWPMPLLRGSLRGRLLTGSLLAALLSNGCCLTEWYHNGFKVGPNYQRPPVPVAHAWIDQGNPNIQTDPAHLCAWWTVFGDPELDKLIDAASRQNLTLHAAGTRILQARARRDIARGLLFPQFQEANGSFSRNKLSVKAANVPPQQWFQEWNAGFNASWELDFWGRFRRLVEVGDAELDASIENYDDVLVILLSDVASNYIQIRTFQWRLYHAWENVLAQRRSYQLAVDQDRLGAGTKLSVQAVATILETTRAAIPELEAQERLANNRLCILLGIPPRELHELGVGAYANQLRTQFARWEEYISKYGGAPRRAEGAEKIPAPPPPLPQPPMPIPSAPAEVAVGIPANLVRQRPDVRRAERRLAAQSARIGVAKADFYPRLSLNGSIGVNAEQFYDLFDTPESLFASVGPSFQWNLLNYGRILNFVRVQEGAFQQRAYEYQQQVLEAGREVEDAIVLYLKAQQRVRTLAKAVAAARGTVEISGEQFRLGATDLGVNALFQGILAQQEDLHAQVQGDIALNLVAIYRSLGGGWEIRLQRDGQVAPCQGGVVNHEELPIQQTAALEAPIPVILPGAE
jgi:outer membrane protein TolC